MMKIVATNVVACQSPNGDRLQRHRSRQKTLSYDAENLIYISPFPTDDQHQNNLLSSPNLGHPTIYIITVSAVINSIR